MAIVERPLAAVVASPAIRTPRQLQNRLVGVTGVPSDTAVLRSIVTGAGGNPSRVRTITIGFNAVPDLLARRVSAATAFWNDEGVALAAQRPGFHSFRAEDYGAPPYPELILTATAATLHRQPALARALVRTLTQGYDFTLAHPARSATELERLVPGLDPKLVSRQLSALLRAFRGATGRVGELDSATLRSWSAWEARFGIVKAPPNVAALFDPAFVQ
jgi:NitT/TauT family transport system substrate-binding protein/putative hydroxymethylpyrimidine transport system substrate-binding protein